MNQTYRRYAPYICIVAVIAGIEIAVWVVGWALGSPGRLRVLMVEYGGFWPGLLRDWQSNYPFQSITMFASYWLFHAGPLHLLGNLGVLLWLSRQLVPVLSPGQTWEIWLASVLGGAVAFGLLENSFTPMIGASGGVFGLLGAYVAVSYQAARRRGSFRRAALRTLLICAAIFALSLVDVALRPGGLAWQAHLGGFLAGAVMAAISGTSRPANR